MVALASTWMVGSIATALVGVAIVPSHPVNGWRVFLALGALPSLACAALSHTLVPESPRYLVARGQPAAALAVLKQAAAANGRPGALDGCSLRQVAPPEEPLSAAVRRKVTTLLSPPLSAVTFPLAFVWFALGFGWFGLVLWLPTYFEERAIAASRQPPPPSSSPFAPPAPPLAALSAVPYWDQLAVASSNLPGCATLRVPPHAVG